MWYADWHETTDLCANAERRRAAGAGEGPARQRRLRPAALPDPVGQILLASACGERAPRIATYLGIDDQTVLDALHAFTASGLTSLQKKSSRAHRTRLVFAPEQAERLRALLQRSPRDFGKPGSRWTLEWAAEVSVAEGIVPTRVSGETIRQTVLRLGLSWKRAKHWITSPDAGYARKKGGAIA
jgi:transposase